jgi:hypothetical protein
MARKRPSPTRADAKVAPTIIRVAPPIGYSCAESLVDDMVGNAQRLGSDGQ